MDWRRPSSRRRPGSITPMDTGLRWCDETGRAGKAGAIFMGDFTAGDRCMDVAAWLQSLGLDRYEPLFRDNEIDWEVLPKLTSEDLKEIGVVAIGHRRKLLDAIAALGAPTPAADASGLHAETIATLVPKGDAERRQLTVMFCDLVGSTSLSAGLDPED